MASLGLLATAGTYYVTTYPDDLIGAATGYTHDLLIKTLTATSFSAKEPPGGDSATHPLYTVTNLTPTTPTFAMDGSLDSATDQDFIQYALPPASSNIFVQVLAPTADINISMYSDPNCQTLSNNANGGGFTAQDNISGANSNRCIQISGFSPNFPAPYTVVIAAQ